MSTRRKRPARHANRPGGRGDGAARVTAPGVLFGLNAVDAALRARRRSLQCLHLRAGGTGRLAELRARAQAAGVPLAERSAAELDTLAAGGHHQGAVLACGPLPPLDEAAALALAAGWTPPPPGEATAPGKPVSPPPPLLLALDQVEDPRNLGAVVRSAAAFGAAGLVLPRDHSAPLSAVASSASAGALERFPVHVVPNLARFLEAAKAGGFWAVGAAAHGGTPLAAYRHDRPLVLVLGSEGRGLRPLVARGCDQLLTIPLPGLAAGNDDTGTDASGLESLNVSAAAAVLLYQLLAGR